MNDPRKLVDVPVHPVADLFPMMSESEFCKLVDDIGAKGQLVPIIMHQGTMLDGRNRYAACRVAKKDPVLSEFDGSGDTASAYIISLNARRRHLPDGQVAAICAQAMPHHRREAEARKKATQLNGKPGPGRGKKTVHANPSEPFNRDHKKEHANSTVGKLAAAAGVSKWQAAKAIEVMKSNPELLADVAKGSTSLNEAHKKVQRAKPEKPKKKKPLRERVIAALNRLLKQFPDEQSQVKTILREQLV